MNKFYSYCKALLCLTAFVLLGYQQTNAQTTLVSSTGDGGFETGGTLAANGWTGVTSVQSWFVGTSTVTAPSAGTNMAYTSTASGSWTPGTSASVAHIYRDITIPAGETQLTVTLKYKTLAVDGTFDYLKVFVVPTSTTPVGGTQLVSGQLGSTTDGTTSYVTYTFSGTVPTGTQRLVISFRQDGFSPYGAAAIDEVSVVSAAPPPPLSGTYTIDNTVATGGTNYNSFTAAINAINTAGISSAVTFNVTAGQTFNESPSALTATGTVTNTITFQRNGAGANPKITPTGTGASTGDFGFCISGGDYITFDGIDVDGSAATTTTNAVEFGYLIRNASATNGAQNNTIKNCAVTLNKNFALTTSACIYSSVSTSQGGTTPSASTGANSTNKYYNLTLSNAQNGVYLVGNSSFPDLTCEVGVSGSGCQTSRNSISNMGGIPTFTSAYGIRVDGQSGVKVFNNNISNIRSNQSSGAGILLITFAGTNEIYNNDITDGANSGSTSSTSRFAGIELQNSTGTPTARVYNNTISNITSPYTSTATASIYAYGIFVNNTTTATVAEIDNNSVNLAPTGTPTYSNACFAMASSSAVQKVRGNVFVNATAAQGITAKHYCWVSTSNTTIGASGSISNYNDLYIKNDAGTSGFVGKGSSLNYTTVATWSAGITSPAGTDANSVSADPQFTSSINLHASASAINAYSGFTPQAWVTTDIDCDTRSATSPHDLGADAFNVVALDMGASALAAPTASVCNNSSVPVTITIKNYGSATINFSVNPVTVTTNVTGAATATLSATVNSGTLASGGTVDVTMTSNLNMSASGTYTFNASTSVSGDGNSGNDAMTAATRTIAASTAIPYTQDFSGGVTPSGWTNTSGWGFSTTHGATNYGMYYNLYSSATSAQFTLPKFGTIGANDYLSFDYRIVNYSLYPGTATPNSPDWGNIAIQVSTDCGNSFTTFQTINSSNHIASLSFANKSYSLAAYLGQNVVFRIVATYSSSSTIPDYYIDFDNFSVTTVVNCSGATGGTASAGVSSLCNSGSTTISATGYSTGAGTTYEWQSSPAGAGVWTNLGSSTTYANLSTGTITSSTDYRLKVTCPSASAQDFSNVATVTVNSALANISANPSLTICSGQSVTLTENGGTATSWLWSTSATTQAITVSPTSTTTYSVTATSAGPCNTNASVTVTVNPVPTGVTANVSLTSICAGGSVNLTSTGNSNETTTTTIASAGFESGLPAGWVVLQGGSGNLWTFPTSLTGAAHTGTRAAEYNYNIDFAANTWMITSGFALTGGTTYTITYWTKTSSGFNEQLKVTVGTAQTIAGQTTTLQNLGSFVSSTYTQRTTTFTPGSSGTYYFGWNCYSLADEYYLDVDDISITTSSPTAATFSWTSSPAGFTSSQQNPTGVVPAANNTTYTVTVSNTNCSASATTSAVTVNPNVTYYRDFDLDGYGDAGVISVSCTGAPSGYVSDNTDCNDNNTAVHPGATEVCNGIDDDCDGSIDEGVQNTYYRDFDGDGYGDAGNTTTACSAPSGYVSDNTDCNDNNSAVHPGATEVCNGIDDDCDGSIDEGVQNTYYRDFDGDGYGDAGSTTTGCSAPSGYVSDNTDCNDNNSAVNPGATEVCNGIDDDCDGSIDEGVQNTYYRDFDGDGYGDAGNTTTACSAPSGYVSDNTDCNDNNSAVNPGATEVCNGIDDDCDGSIDEGVQNTYYLDFDGDGYGNAAITTTACSAPSGYVSNSTDCNDNNSAVNPGATEICGNSIDDDCDGSIDEGCGTYTFYEDSDGDGYGNPNSTVTNSTGIAPSGYVSDNTDCNDNNASVHPGATEVCNGIDDDCDGSTDEGFDVDGDGYTTCQGDCNDNNPAVNPGATEICNGIDDDCDGQIDEGVQNTYYRDFDGDGYGDAGNTTTACSAPSGYVSDNTDCNDNNSAVHPGATEVCNGIDDDCDGQVDETTLNASSSSGTISCVGGTTSVVVSATGGNPPYSGTGTFTVSAGTHTYTVTDAHGCTSSTSVTVADGTGTAPAQPNKITGQFYNLCGGGTFAYSVQPVPGATSYIWTVPAGYTVATGQGTNSVTITIPASLTTTATIQCKASNSCGNSANRSLTIYAVGPNPSSAINGPTSVSAGQTSVLYSMPNVAGLTYTWVAPTGASITTGQGTYRVRITFGSTSGFVRVTVSNACGSSPQGRLSVTVNAPLAANTPASSEAVAANTSMKAFPNPVQQVATVVFNSQKTDSKYELRLTDLAGKTMMVKSIIAFKGENQVKLDMSKYANGMYLVSLVGDNDTQTLKLYKEK